MTRRTRMVGYRAGKAPPLLPGGQSMPHLAERLMSGALLALLLAGAGCSGLHSGPSLCSLTRTIAPAATAKAVAQKYLAEADALEEAGDAGCVDRYFAACSWAWQALCEDAGGTAHVTAGDCYNGALDKLL